MHIRGLALGHPKREFRPEIGNRFMRRCEVDTGSARGIAPEQRASRKRPLWSAADIMARSREVRFTPDSEHLALGFEDTLR